jgi:nucleotide-binding universal stress UspA family protein
MTFKKILIAVDQGPIAARAADVGIELAHSLDAEIAVIHTYEPPVIYGTDIGVPPDELAAMAKEEAARVLRGFRQRKSLEPAILEFLEVGKPAEEIVKAAKSWPADLIVIGSHGRSGVNRVLLGSVAEAVARDAPCPVLIVRAQD